MKLMLRIILLCLIVVIAFTALFPQWLDFARAVHSDASGQQRWEKEQAEFEFSAKYPIREDRQLRITGSLIEKPFDIDITYTVVYTSRADKPGCHDYSLMAGKGPDVKFHRYRSNIVDDLHSIDLPLNEHPPYKGCHFQPSTISIGISRAGEKASRAEDLFGDGKHLRDHIKSGYSTSLVNDNQLALECRQVIISDQVFHSNWSCRQKRGESDLKPLIQALKPSSQNQQWVVDINFIAEAQTIADELRAKNNAIARDNVSVLNRLVGTYLEVVNDPVRHKPASELLSVIHHNVDMSAYQGSPFIERYHEHLARVKKTVPHDNDIPVDPWGRPYQYTLRQTNPSSSARPVLFSLGADGIESDDDVGIWKRQTRR